MFYVSNTWIKNNCITTLNGYAIDKSNKPKTVDIVDDKDFSLKTITFDEFLEIERSVKNTSDNGYFSIQVLDIFSEYQECRSISDNIDFYSCIFDHRSIIVRCGNKAIRHEIGLYDGLRTTSDVIRRTDGSLFICNDIRLLEYKKDRFYRYEQYRGNSLKTDKYLFKVSEEYNAKDIEILRRYKENNKQVNPNYIDSKNLTGYAMCYDDCIIVDDVTNYTIWYKGNAIKMYGTIIDVVAYRYKDYICIKYKSIDLSKSTTPKDKILYMSENGFFKEFESVRKASVFVRLENSYECSKSSFILQATLK